MKNMKSKGEISCIPGFGLKVEVVSSVPVCTTLFGPANCCLKLFNTDFVTCCSSRPWGCCWSKICSFGWEFSWLNCATGILSGI